MIFNKHPYYCCRHQQKNNRHNIPNYFSATRHFSNIYTQNSTCGERLVLCVIGIAFCCDNITVKFWLFFGARCFRRCYKAPHLLPSAPWAFLQTRDHPWKSLVPYFHREQEMPQSLEAWGYVWILNFYHDKKHRSI